jgi:Ca2+-binding RTX toxin-like protein
MAIVVFQQATDIRLAPTGLVVQGSGFSNADVLTEETGGWALSVAGAFAYVGLGTLVSAVPAFAELDNPDGDRLVNIRISNIDVGSTPAFAEAFRAYNFKSSVEALLAGDDRISGSDGNDGILAGAGDDTVAGGTGNDYLDGGDGFDFADYSAATAGVTIDLGITTAQSTGGAGIDTLINFEGVIGSEFADVLMGRSGDDRLLGGRGNDVLDGGLGADLLIGGRGRDKSHTGGADGVRDTVRFTSLLESGVTSATRDQVQGFVRRQDKIDLSPIDANPLVSGNQAFKVVSAFTSAPGEVRLAHFGTNTLIQIDGDRDTGIDMVIAVIGTRVSAGDLIL